MPLSEHILSCSTRCVLASERRGAERLSRKKQEKEDVSSFGVPLESKGLIHHTRTRPDLTPLSPWRQRRRKRRGRGELTIMGFLLGSK
jgi:hypothetical protein